MRSRGIVNKMLWLYGIPNQKGPQVVVNRIAFHDDFKRQVRETPVRLWIKSFELLHGFCWTDTLRSYGWPVLDTYSIPYGDEGGPGRSVMAKWCDDTFGRNNWALNGLSYVFMSEHDLVHFKLTFSDLLA